MAQAQVDEWCIEAAKHHYVPVSDTQYGPVPREARGIPHQTFPGLHAYLDEYADAMERARTLGHRGPAHGRQPAVPAALALCRAPGSARSRGKR